MTTYASHAQVVDWLTGGPYADDIPAQDADTLRLRTRATDVIADATFGLVELVSGTQLPADPDLVQADGRTLGDVLADAVCAQIEQWCEVGEENDIAGYPEGTTMQLSAGAITKLPDTLAPRAARILRRAGLTAVDSTDQALTVELV